MIHKVLRLSTLPPAQSQHGQQEFAERLGGLHIPHVLLHHDSLQRPRLQIPYVSQLALGVKQLPAVPPAHLQIRVKVTKEFDDQCHVIIVLRKQVCLSLGIKQVLRSEEFEHDTRDGPDVRGVCPVCASQDGFWGSVLPCLDILGEVPFGRCRITEICYLD